VELRRWNPGQAEALRVAVEDSFDELHTWMPWAAERPTEHGMRTVLSEGAEAFDRDAEWSYVVGVPGGDEVLGAVGLHPRSGPGTVEIGYRIRTGVTGRGYATAAARVLTTAAFAHLADVGQVEIRVDAANRRSGAVPTRLGNRTDREVSLPVVAPGQSGRWYVHVMERDRWPVDAG
jgi:RimJ/RimL family protein N-acetyltransferase